MKIQKKWGGPGGRVWGCGGGVRVWGGGQGGCELRIEVFLKIHKRNRGGGSGGGVRWGLGWWGVRVDLNEELKFL